MTIESADEVLEALKPGRFRLSIHAMERMAERSVTQADIRACGHTAIRCLRQLTEGRIRVDGRDLDGELLAVICVWDDGLLVITIF